MAAKGNFDSALEQGIQCLSHFGLSRELLHEQTKTIYTLVSEEDLLAILPTDFGKRPLILITSSCQGYPDYCSKTSSVKILLLVQRKFCAFENSNYWL